MKLVKSLIGLIILFSLVSCGEEVIERRHKEIKNVHFTNEEMNVMSNICTDLGINVADLLIVIENESNYNYKAVNPISGAVGLIQFMPNTLKDFNLTTTQLLNMTVIEQLYVIEKYYSRYTKYNLDSPMKLLLITFYPYGLKVYNNNDYVFGSQTGPNTILNIANQNYVYDLNKDGEITMLEFKTYHNNNLLKN